MELLKKLNAIQRKLSVPKSQINSFGRYNYRSCEDILEAVKPLLDGAVIVISDEIINIGSRYYVKATVSLKEGAETISNTAYAREAEEKKGMDISQITGATSSYARKYALNGMLLIDDTKDADAMDNTHKQQAKPQGNANINPVIADTVNKLKNYQKPNTDDKPWITDELFKDAVKKSVEAGVFKVGMDINEPMKILRMKYKVAKKYEALISNTIAKYAMGING